MFVRVFSLHKKEISANIQKISKAIFRVVQNGFPHGFGAFQTIPQALRASRPYRKGAMSWCVFCLCATEKAKTKSEFSQFSTPKVCTFKTKDFRRSFFFALRSDTDRLPSF
ncbi:MAG TPA: hypothetical protein DCE08_06505 [Ruminococcaceae bacterium]|nr:hypothetical protein [Oscillospiraceae bacterium]